MSEALDRPMRSLVEVRVEMEHRLETILGQLYVAAERGNWPVAERLVTEGQALARRYDMLTREIEERDGRL